MGTIPIAQVAAKTNIMLAKMTTGFRRVPIKLVSYEMIRSRSRKSSTRFRALIVTDVRPTVSKKVLCTSTADSVIDDSGISANSLTFLCARQNMAMTFFVSEWNTHSAPSGRRTRTFTCSYSTPSACLGPSKKGTLRT